MLADYALLESPNILIPVHMEKLGNKAETLGLMQETALDLSL